MNQLVVNMKRVNKLGAKKIAVTALEPLGCLPQSTILNSFQQCNATENIAVDLHNSLLQQAVEKLNNETMGSTFVILDLFSSFNSVLASKGAPGMSFDTASLKEYNFFKKYNLSNLNETHNYDIPMCRVGLVSNSWTDTPVIF